MTRRVVLAGGALAAAAGVYVGAASGRLTVDLGWGRSRRALGPLLLDVAAPRELVFDVIAGPYLGRTPRAMAERLRVVERGSDMVLAEHRTPVRRAWWPPPWRPSASPGPNGWTSGWYAARCRWWWRSSSCGKPASGPGSSTGAS